MVSTSTGDSLLQNAAAMPRGTLFGGSVDGISVVNGIPAQGEAGEHVGMKEPLPEKVKMRVVAIGDGPQMQHATALVAVLGRAWPRYLRENL